MKKLLILLLSACTFILFSCGEVAGEKDAIKTNQEGIEFMNAGKYELALQSFLKAIKNTRLSKDSRGTILRNIALTYNDLNKKDSAVHFCILASKCYKKNSFHYFVNLAEVDILMGHTAAALERLLKAVKINPDAMSVNNSLGLIYLGDYDATLTDLDKALIYNVRAFEINDSRVTEEVLARTYFRMGNYEKAESHYEQLNEKYPAILSYLLNMGMAKFKLKKNTEAEKLFEKVVASDSSYSQTINTFKENNR